MDNDHLPDWPQPIDHLDDGVEIEPAESGPPRILLTVPSMEGWHTGVELLQRTGAQATRGRREFEITGPLNTAQATALAELARFVDAHGDKVHTRAVAVENHRALDVFGSWAEQMKRQRQLGANGR